MAFGDADRSVFVEPGVWGAAVRVGTQAGYGLLTLRWIEDGEYGMRTQEPVLTFPRGAFTAPALDASVTVGGVAYKYRGKVDASPDAAPATSGFESWVLVGGTTS
jgi:hypothetical protein